MKIVKTKKSHLKGLLSVGKENWTYEKWLTKRFLSNTLESKGIHITALIGKRVVGGIMVLELDRPKFWIFFFAVAKDMQRKGIGTALLRKAGSGVSKNCFLFVDLTYNDKSGIKFYKKNGFRDMGKVKNWFESGKTGVMLAKKMG